MSKHKGKFFGNLFFGKINPLKPYVLSLISPLILWFHKKLISFCPSFISNI